MTTATVFPASIRMARSGATLTRALVVALGALLMLTLTACTTSPSVALPASFPADAVTVTDGTIVEAEAAESGWLVTVKVPDAAAQEAAVAQLTESGFTVIGESDDAVTGRAYSLANDSYAVRVGLSESGGSSLVEYSVSPRP